MPLPPKSSIYYQDVPPNTFIVIILLYVLANFLVRFIAPPEVQSWHLSVPFMVCDYICGHVYSVLRFKKDSRLLRWLVLRVKG